MKNTPNQLIPKILGFGLFTVLTLASCGSVDDPQTDPAPVEQVGGVYTVVAASDNNGTIELGEPPTVSIDPEFGTLKIDSGCNDHFGSFTLADDGLASFTIAGQTNTVCDALTEATERRVIDAFGQLDGWTQDAGNLELFGDGVVVTLNR